jgi:hypothetical protein
LQQWEGEARGLAGTRLGGGENVFTAQNGRYRLLLNGGGCVVALLAYGTQQSGLEAKGIECQ